ncbi:hypothetical protein [Actinomadura macrotermitis]|uniref:Uncharacterized protein n=1 Tax=Actinomadura macrotermitis TaxID=2585200 RepID=A0A7K0BZD5_9ACTN|nr:hypothetical protein [Actinomadura macrotermitis]MQY06545.1 hypothetical protein [Actinomadura macrotermitis]
MAEASTGRRPAALLLRRWPTALAVASALLVMSGGAAGGFGELLLLLPLEYLAVAQVGRRGASWPVVGALTTVVMVAGLLDVAPVSTVLAGIALVLLVWGAIGGSPHGRAVFGVQAAGMIGFGALAAAGLLLEPEAGRYLVAAGWFLHGVWDFVHLKQNKVVSRSYAEWCGVLDLLVAAQLVFLL